MPRNRRGVRAWALAGMPVDRLSPATAALIHMVEVSGRTGREGPDAAAYDPDPYNEHVRPGHTAYLLRRYRRFLRRPGRVLWLEAAECSCGDCQYDDMAVVRDGLEEMARRLPPAASTELRRLLDRLDDEFERRTVPDPVPRTGRRGEELPWWHLRVYQS
ncbi:hypothetical protein ACQP00_32540 [Dactylosporangium sp. CS-047395]|uniref:hypothetical protein n=1 Tax=Dactylosporangium sp. CS-047395 TaxID=3239936 RepID=UPI003D9176AB